MYQIVVSGSGEWPVEAQAEKSEWAETRGSPGRGRVGEGAVLWPWVEQWATAQHGQERSEGGWAILAKAGFAS